MERLASKEKPLFMLIRNIGFKNHGCNRYRERLQDKAGQYMMLRKPSFPERKGFNYPGKFYREMLQYIAS
jgi:hypothetical protein